MAIEDNIWDLIISHIAPNRQCFLRQSESYLFRKHRRSGVAESQKLSSGANVQDYHAQNDRMGPFQSEIILIDMTYVMVHVYNKVFLKNTLLQNKFVARYFSKVRCINFQGFFEKYQWAKLLSYTNNFALKNEN